MQTNKHRENKTVCKETSIFATVGKPHKNMLGTYATCTIPAATAIADIVIRIHLISQKRLTQPYMKPASPTVGMLCHKIKRKRKP